MKVEAFRRQKAENNLMDELCTATALSVFTRVCIILKC